ncbi:family 43 glycosylhydrolase [Sphingomonas psychrotolerans]|uniref:Glycosyl hydrolase 43 family protein n=1 Tax=Sphingomonas psychrotolerans TaxID=1327635 RepID=A0A2K8MRB2_9SPHN|nr:family 43 glycosylhydrolase [Sphingomonas psychrotolerans]ATY34559.1 glycosyl hydrolase 43 family protein [Sphingomonas psychrotolerans]
MRALVLIAALLAGLPPAASAQEVKSVFVGADPDIEAAEGRWWIYPTGGDGLSAWSSPDKVKWTKSDPLIRLKDIAWADNDRAPRHYLWAPDMVQAAGGWYFYYSVGPQNPTPSRLGVAVCKGPAGPCTDSGKPLVTGGKGFEAIDPAVFIDPKSKTPYLYAGGSAGATLRVWALKPDMVNIDREVPVETPPNFTEGAFVHYRKGIYYLSWSAGRWNDSSYQVHYAVALSPIGPWRYGGALLVGDRKYRGPGHHSFFEDPKDGQWYIVYHRWEGQIGDGPYSGDRRVAIQKIAYRDDGAILPIKMK